MNKENIRRIPLAEKDIVVNFLNENWGSAHPLVNNSTLFDYYYLDGYRLCDECWGEKVRDCIHCEEPHFKDDMIRVFVRIPLSKEYQNKLFEDGYDEPKEGEEGRE